MPAVMRRTCRHGGSIRLGPDCYLWGDDFTRSLPFEIEKVNTCVIGGLTKPKLSSDEYRWLEALMIENGLKPVMDRVVRDTDGKPLRDESGNPIFRRVRLPMPSLKRRSA